MAEPRRNIRIDCGKYLVRTIKLDDASDRWASWTADPGAVETLNATPKPLSKAELVTYIKRFDQWSHWLLGIFAVYSFGGSVRSQAMTSLMSPSVILA